MTFKEFKEAARNILVNLEGSLVFDRNEAQYAAYKGDWILQSGPNQETIHLFWNGKFQGAI